jgi:multimeric flavodoxin WrbA
MKKLGIVYHSPHGHTAHFARYVASGGRSVSAVTVQELPLESIETPHMLTDLDGLILGSPTYLGGVSGPFKSFMDSTGGLWRTQSLKGRLAAGFTVSSLPSGDKLSTLLSMFVFSMQHGMIWIGNPFLPGTMQGDVPEQAVNRLGSWTGAMAQAAHGTAPDQAFLPGDLSSAEMFGRNFAEVLAGQCLERRAASDSNGESW